VLESGRKPVERARKPAGPTRNPGGGVIGTPPLEFEGCVLALFSHRVYARLPWKRQTLALLLGSLCATAALATTYVRTEKDGTKTYSDRPIPGGQPIDVQPRRRTARRHQV
jgi:hypothetical protein